MARETDTATAPQSVDNDLGFDPDALHAKYQAERDKRLRTDGNEQYVEIAGRFAHYLDDPYVAPLNRAPLHDDVEVLIVGGGFGGLLAGARLRQAGVEDIRIIEKGGDFGGTWYWNRYPGAACDIESYIYLPLLEEIGYMPVEKYSRAPEILKHSRAIGKKFDLYRNACFQTEVTEMRWDENAARWIVRTNRDDAMRARFIVMANGPLHRPKLPGIPGIESFKGHSFHTSRWDYAYTGGDSTGNLAKLSDKRVGIIGTGATAVQCVPHLGQAAKHLYVFQRTPSSIDVRANRPTDAQWAEGLEPGWQKRRMDNFNVLVSGGFQDEDLVNDGWTDIIGNILFLARKRQQDGAPAEDAATLMQLADFKKMEQVRARVDSIVADQKTAEALKPYYNQFCKRPCFHDEYLQTFNRPNVTLVDTAGQGVERITEHGIVANGREYEIDCLIYATGFEVGTSYTRRSGYELYGRGGLALSEKWKDGVATLHGMHTRGFPNVFIMSNAQSGFTANFPHMLDEQSRHLAYIVRHAASHQIRVVEAAQEAESAWVETIASLAIMRQKFFEECTPGYYNNEGKLSPLAARSGPYGAGPIAFVQVLEDWRSDGTLKGLELTAS
ncbi:MAG: NAD(P)/FAD-dependent oxidoreductase [Alphaproteobacteria bacterium]|jgi:cyclohexanone monooxygenase|nr:NAD(P)/FAD-dependent oxidoreductase [Alphaproteobacteria bacterium]MBN9559012.1 NAD(P)/FAD-dependent oxidoreductase [Alphaproteobacteria bacterium]MBN9568048.1 NAD(P)/FAD-dependent oxidoreductase [Alphaproteobacteria bacterium]MBN9576839.1 NAD(P)/FAD-dependent oxidoreductase [Alphaproteobacteria bacterium]MBN9590680.1 NAD(P)/FAD-dependent oxidoreductase [Alphaproteobacteria bacterium]